MVNGMKYKTILLNTFKRQELFQYFSQSATNIDYYFYGDFGVVIIGNETTVDLPFGNTTQVKIDFFLNEDVFDDFIYKFRIHFSRGGA